MNVGLINYDITIIVCKYLTLYEDQDARDDAKCHRGEKIHERCDSRTHR